MERIYFNLLIHLIHPTLTPYASSLIPHPFLPFRFVPNFPTFAANLMF